jgi:hypothetical protein
LRTRRRRPMIGRTLASGERLSRAAAAPWRIKATQNVYRKTRKKLCVNE